MPRNSIPIASRTVPENCYPFEEDQSSCQLPRSAQHEVLKPVFLEKFEILRTCPNLKGRRGLFKMQPSYRVGRPNNPKHPRRTEHDIMFEIMTHGPVQGSNPAPFPRFLDPKSYFVDSLNELFSGARTRDKWFQWHSLATILWEPSWGHKLADKTNLSWCHKASNWAAKCQVKCALVKKTDK